MAEFIALTALIGLIGAAVLTHLRIRRDSSATLKQPALAKEFKKRRVK